MECVHSYVRGCVPWTHPEEDVSSYSMAVCLPLSLNLELGKRLAKLGDLPVPSLCSAGLEVSTQCSPSFFRGF